MLIVNEIYGPVKQGEGKSAGKDVVFLRLSCCNLACIWCDTPYTWNWTGTKFAHPDKFNPKEEAHKMTAFIVEEVLREKAGHVRGLVVSGGEPMLQQYRLLELFQQLKRDPRWWLEVETNGTIEPSAEFVASIDQFNCSPKTSNSGPDNPREDRINPAALQTIAGCGKGTFKFVIQSDADLSEAQEIMEIGHITPKQVWLMPEGKTKQEQEERQDQVKALVDAHGYNFSPRLHILEFGNARAV